MRAVRHTESGIETIDAPEPTGPGALVRVASAGICGSDLHMLGWGPMPFTLGHEVGGRLEDGTPVAVWPSRPCGTCDRCQAGEPTQCRTGMGNVYGSTSGDGGMAGAMVVEDRCIVPLPTGVDPGDAALVEPIACSVHAFTRGGVQRGDRVAVVGAGSIGIGAAAVARWLDCPVDVLARHDAQRAAATAIGAGLDPAGEYDVVVEAAGTTSALEACFGLLRPGGTVIFVGTHWEPVQFPAFFTSKEPRMVAAVTHTHDPAGSDMAGAAQLLADLPEVAPAMITHRIPIDRAADAFRIAADRSAGAIKVVIEP
jgi:threonine dehydrogenase-like Zn-dependent dehydrogenase